MIKTTQANSELVALFCDWIENGNSDPFYLDGIAGCGKSTQVAEHLLPIWLGKYRDSEVRIIAPTHAAKDELRAKIPYLPDDNFMTVHSYCGLAPQTDEGAVNTSRLRRLRQMREALEADLVVMDEAGMTDPECAAVFKVLLKEKIVKRVVFLGDKHQLKPVSGEAVLVAPEPYPWHYVLTVNYRARRMPDVQEHIYHLYRKISSGFGTGIRFKPEPSANLTYVDELPPLDYRVDRALAFTHNMVQKINAAYMGRENIEPEDVVYSRNTKKYYTMIKFTPALFATMSTMRTMERVRQNPGEEPAEYAPLLNNVSDRFKVREFLSARPEVQIGQFQEVVLVEGEWQPAPATEPENWFFIYGSSNYNQACKSSTEAAIEANNIVCERFHLQKEDLEDFCKDNWGMEEVRAKKLAWRWQIACDRTVLCVDAPYCTTVHAAQGATHRHTLVALGDLQLAKAVAANTDNFARLCYVAISRATDKLMMLDL